MPTTLLQTKLFLPPVRPHLVVRERQLQRLDAGLAGRLTLVCAPAGFGKTTLVSGWLLKEEGGRRKAEGGRWNEVPERSGVEVEGGTGAGVPAFERGADEVAPEPLSEREVEVLQLLAQGF